MASCMQLGRICTNRNDKFSIVTIHAIPVPYLTTRQPQASRSSDTPATATSRGTKRMVVPTTPSQGRQSPPGLFLQAPGPAGFHCKDSAAADHAAPPKSDHDREQDGTEPSRLFTCFARLPSELRTLVWREAYLDLLASQPCVCIYQGGTLPMDDINDVSGFGGRGARGLRYNHAVPAVYPESAPLEVVCREARRVCAAQRCRAARPRRQASPAAETGPDGAMEKGTPPTTTASGPQLPLPSRDFNPATDILYIDRQKRHGDGSTIVFYLGDRTQWVRHIRHIALPFSLILDIARQPALLRHLVSLEKISLVFPVTSTTGLESRSHDHPASGRGQMTPTAVTLWSSISLPTPTPTRRVRLRALSTSEMAQLRIMDDPWRPPSTLAEQRSWTRDGETGRDFVELVKSSIGNCIRRTDQYSRDLQRFYWDAEDGSFRITVEGCVLV
ncbi:hypothetical protein Micbo1qcDRAFT_179941 [Microdochium bolleyi]|uniref:2EXR domain-containing protein n=1 Tax=Microdochium bolleyi TaxID=196109 RepID=A0A136IN86_9PEZI|nr:hypothetical protein Micbo1qcDRAFT_179941 [Microdochium bolleyi]